jgi:hypothetical protein
MESNAAVPACVLVAAATASLDRPVEGRRKRRSAVPHGTTQRLAPPRLDKLNAASAESPAFRAERQPIRSHAWRISAHQAVAHPFDLRIVVRI